MALGTPSAPPQERLNAGDWRLLWIAAAVVVVSLGVAARYFHVAFPEASIDFQISGGGSMPVAQRFLEARGLSLVGFRHAEQFDYDDTAKTFLEREVGLAVSGPLLSHALQLWRWDNRWFQPLDAEEYQVEVSTSGAVVSFDHVIADSTPGASLDEATARARAEQFLRQTMGEDPSRWVAVDAAREVKPHRIDYTFTWRDAAPLVPNATGAMAQAQHRHQVVVEGGEVGAYFDYLQVPQQWSRDYARLRSKNDSTGLVDTGVILILFVALLFVLVMRIRRGDVRWRLALWMGVAGAVLSFLSALNGLGSDIFAYDTTQSWRAFLASTVFGDLASAVGVGVFFVVLTAAAEALYRERFTRQVAVENYLSWRGLRSKAFLLSMALGLALAAFFFAYQTVFYLIANHLGAWAPADVPYDQLLNTKLPWAFVLFSGFFPAISEEFGFRMFAIPLLEKWFRWLWVAVLAASFAWGFGHATYPNQPFYIRGVEVGLGGILLSWIMIRFGILATVVWHYTVDAFYTAMLLLRAHDAYLRWSGAATAFLAVLPLLLAIAFYRRGHGFAAEAGLTNAATGTAPPLPAPVQPEPTAPLPPYAPIPGQNWTTGLIVAGALLSALAVPIARWRTALPWRLGARAAESASGRFLAGQGYSAAGYRVAATLETAAENGHGEQNEVTADDVFARSGLRAMYRAFSGPTPTVIAAYWHLRYFQPLQPEEFNLAVRPDNGQVIAFDHTLAETAPGGAPTLQAAQSLAARFLAGQRIQAGSMTLVTARQQQRPARVDSTFVWQAATPGAAMPPPNPLPGEAAYRVEADLAGGQLSYFGGWYHLPEARLRQFEQSTLGSTALVVLKGLLYAAAALLIFVLILRFARQAALAWGTLIKISVVAGVAMGVIAANNWPLAVANYSTDTPWSAFLLSTGFSVLVAGLEGFLLTLALLAPLAITAPRATALTVANARRQLERESAWDALWVGLLALAWVLGWQQVQAVVNSRWHQAGTPVWPAPPAGLAQLVPGLADVIAAPLHALWIAAGLGILAPALSRAWNNQSGRYGRIGCVAGVALIWIGTFPTIHHPAQFGLAAIFSGVNLLLLFGFAHLFLRASPLAYLSAALVPSLALPAEQWLGTPVPRATGIGLVLAGLAAVWLLWLAWVARNPTEAGR